MPDTRAPGTDTTPTADAAAAAVVDDALAGDAPADDAVVGDALVDVAVVGAGPVGLLLAGLLLQRGLSVVVLEARKQGSEHSRAIGIHPPGLAVLAQLGLAEAAIAAGTPIFRGEAWCDGELLGGLDISEAAGRYPFVLALPQRETERLLRERLVELNGGRDPVRRGARVVALAQRGEAVEITVDAAGGAGRGVRARYIVGADGARSRVREYSGIRWRAFGDAQPYLMGDFRSEVGRPGERARPGHPGALPASAGLRAPTAAPHAATTALLAFERGGVVESFPLPGGWRRWVVLTEGLKAAPRVADLTEIVRQRTGIELGPALGSDEDARRSARSISAFAVRQHLAGSMAAGRIALAGDAAHEVSPIGGQGMNLGWLDAAALAPALELAVRGGPALGARALAEYGAQRRRAARRTVLQASFNMGVGQPARGRRLAARNALVRLLARPPFRALLAQAFTMRGL